MKGLARRNIHEKYESPSTYQSKAMTKVKVLEGQTPRSKVIVSNERSYLKEYTCEISKP
jgi:hypothetical protein